MSVKSKNKFKIGAVSFFNAKPLIYQLDANCDVELISLPPARLAQLLANNRLDAALVPSIDYQRSAGKWQILPCAAIGSCGEVLTVRVFSHVPLENITRLLCDCDSHTSVCLAKIIWHLRYDLALQTVSLDTHNNTHNIHKGTCVNQYDTLTKKNNHTAILLIGDKVLNQLNHWEYQVDLGQVWTEITGFPFVYAFWAIPAKDIANADEDRQYKKRILILADILRQASVNGQKNIDWLISKYAARHGFTPEIAHTYLNRNICFNFAREQVRGLEEFYRLAHKLDLIEHLRPIIPVPVENARQIGV